MSTQSAPTYILTSRSVPSHTTNQQAISSDVLAFNDQINRKKPASNTVSKEQLLQEIDQTRATLLDEQLIISKLIINCAILLQTSLNMTDWVYLMNRNY